MQDYTLNEKEKENYIQEVIKKPNKTLEITFASGRVFKNIEYNEENLSKIVTVQEEQVQKAIANKKVFKDKQGYAKMATLLTLSLSTAASTLGSMTLIANSVDPVFVGVGVGVLMIFSNIPSTYKLVKNSEKLKELEKLAYRNEHKDQLDRIKEYENALAGLPRKKRQKFRQKDPFSILHVEQFSQKDLETIVENIEKEDSFQFAYKRTTTKKTRNEN